MIGDFSLPTMRVLPTIPSKDEIKKKEQLDVPLPANNLDMNTLVKSL